jgi:hypothetical protein
MSLILHGRSAMALGRATSIWQCIGLTAFCAEKVMFICINLYNPGSRTIRIGIFWDFDKSWMLSSRATILV